MKISRQLRHTGERMPSRRRPLGRPTLTELLARRRRLRTRIGLALAMILPVGLLLAEFG